MKWASLYIRELKKGNTVNFRPTGNSMSGIVESGQLCTVEPSKNIKVNDVVLCEVNQRQYLHLVKEKGPTHFHIGNNKGGSNGWITIDHIYGKLIKVED